MNFKVEVEKFDGPLDLMLHLIKNHKLDIFDLDIKVLIEQYLKYLSNLKELKLEIESEYLLELSTLIEYKSKKLLPNNKEEIEEDYGIDLKERLVKRLLEYQKFKDVSENLRQLYDLRRQEYAKFVSSIEIEENNDFNADVYDLYKAMNRILKRNDVKTVLSERVAEKEVSIEERISYLYQKIEKLPSKFRLNSLIEDCKDKTSFVVTFLAILDLIKAQYIVFELVDEEVIFNRREYE